MDKTSGCEPLSITLTNCSGSPANYIFEYPSSSSPTSDTTYTYTVTNPDSVCQHYSIFQEIGSNTGGGALDSVFSNIIRVCKPVAPSIEVLICENNQAFVQTTDTVYDAIRVNMGDGTVLTLQPNETMIHQYAAAGDYTVLAEGFFNASPDACGNVEIRITASADIPPATLSASKRTQAGDITLYYELPANVHYILEEQEGSGAFQQVAALSDGTNSLMLSGKSLTAAYTYRIGALNPCGGNTVYSAELPLLTASANAEGDANVIRWESYEALDLVSYQIFRDDVLLTSPANTAIRYDDMNIFCGQSYHYQLVVSLSGNRTDTLDLGNVVAIGTQQPITVESLLPSVVNGQLVVSWSLSEGEEIASLLLFRTWRNTTDTINVLSQTGAWIDSAADPTTDTICYQLSVKDACENESSSTSFCNLILSGEKIGFDNQLRWHPYVGFGNDYEFVLETLNDDGSVAETFPALAFNELEYLDPGPFADQQIKRYRLKAVSLNNAAQVVYSNVIEFVEALEIIVPDAFTPNDDGLNDEFEVHGKFIQSIQLEVYNRWGVKIFRSESLDDRWDGTFENNQQPQGVYTYIIEGTDTFGNSFTKKGTVLLLRN
ncbi:MAG: gliding motility-associated C-terminal domain-containing protein [Flammeovirgaceae bacterium]